MASQEMIVSLPCYDSNGKRSENDLQCNPDGEASACCAPGWQCVNNLYCRRGNVNKPGSCTDENWSQNGNPACPCPPLNDAEDYLSNTILCSTNAYLCTSRRDGGNRSAADCTNSAISLNPMIDYGNGLGVPTETAASALMAYYSGLAVTTASLSSRLSAASSTSASTTSSTASMSDGNSGLGSSAKIGLGVGIGIGVLLISLAAAILFVMWRRRRRSQGPDSVVSPTKTLLDSPDPEYRALGQEKPSELPTMRGGTTELPASGPMHELFTARAEPAELGSR